MFLEDRSFILDEAANIRDGRTNRWQGISKEAKIESAATKMRTLNFTLKHYEDNFCNLRMQEKAGMLLYALS